MVPKFNNNNKIKCWVDRVGNREISCDSAMVHINPKRIKKIQ
jgi:hypothetical protein